MVVLCTLVSWPIVVTCMLKSWVVTSGCEGLVDMFDMDLKDLVDVKRKILNVIVVYVCVCVCVRVCEREKEREKNRKICVKRRKKTNKNPAQVSG